MKALVVKKTLAFSVRGPDSAAEVLDVRNGGSAVDRKGDVTMRLWRWVLARCRSRIGFGSDGVLLADLAAMAGGL